MSGNLLLTGPPRSGKSTALEQAASRLRKRGLTVGGLVSPEIRDSTGRIGFRLVDVGTGEDAVMAHVDLEHGPSVGKYRVNVGAVDELSASAIQRALEDDVVLVDEIAPMEVHSDVFVEQIQRALDSDVPVVGTVHQRSSSGFIGEVKAREDVDILEVTRSTREAIPAIVVERLQGGMGG